MAAKSLRTIREILQAYADRGIFRGFSEKSGGRFHFIWMMRHEMELKVEAEKNTLRFKNLLPGIPARSAMYAELKKFIEERHDPALPEHRRIDRRLAEASCLNRAGRVSISMRVKKNQYEYSVNRLVNLVHELFVHLRSTYPEYLVENFDVPEE
ncbi:MAG: hypothetical protein IPM66_15995 [Acidobacteriota bacterium]|nr:MAG: hypothetical protein IPM66_15995 [Acidobacteriota bacterium]